MIRYLMLTSHRIAFPDDLTSHYWTKTSVEFLWNLSPNGFLVVWGWRVWLIITYVGALGLMLDAWPLGEPVSQPSGGFRTTPIDSDPNRPPSSDMIFILHTYTLTHSHTHADSQTTPSGLSNHLTTTVFSKSKSSLCVGGVHQSQCR